ncbi:MAG: 2-oxo acid dehydrogenase subunit E2, partial [Pseudomonadales bacterium]|nr:2-oxo acid dehydrogenase subunit E2 [Pseudomonadales bacterium]
MSIEIKAPSFPESVADGTVATWHKQVGEPCGRDELIADIETDKVVIEINAPSEGTLTEIIKAEGEIILSNELIARFEAGAVAEAPAPAVAEPVAAQAQTDDELIISPAAKKMMAENNITDSEVTGSGKAGRVTKEDVQAVIDQRASAPVAAPVASAAVASSVAPAIAMPVLTGGDRPERRVPMTRLRARIAERLLTATQTTAMLTTFNEVNMQPVMELRAKYKAQFEKTHNGTRLGFMSFFVRAATEALKRFPA